MKLKINKKMGVHKIIHLTSCLDLSDLQVH